MRQRATGSRKSETRRAFVLLAAAFLAAEHPVVHSLDDEQPAGRRAPGRILPAMDRTFGVRDELESRRPDLGRHRAREVRIAERREPGARFNLTTSILDGEIPLQDEEAPAVDRMNRTVRAWTTTASTPGGNRRVSAP